MNPTRPFVPSPTRLCPYQRLALASAVTLVLAACGGGGSSSASSNSATAPSLDVVAATGAPMVGASVVVTDATGDAVQTCNPCTTDGEGRLAVPLKPVAKAPFVLVVTPDPAIGGLPQVGLSTDSQGGHVNVTPISTLIAAQLAGGDPTALKPSDIDTGKLQSAKDAVLKSEVMAALLAAVGADTIDPLNDKNFKADGKGLDQALDAIHLQFFKNDQGQAQVQAEVKLSGTTAPATLTVAGGTAPVSQGQANITKAALPASGLSPLMAQLLKNAQTCMNQSYAQRVLGQSAKYLSAECKALFVQNDPSQYKHNGYTVGPSTVANSAFTALFSNRDTTGPNGSPNLLTFDTPVYEYTRGDNEGVSSVAGDVVMTVHWKDLLGNEDWDQWVVRKNTAGDRLQLVGNQYNYYVKVSPFAQRRLFLEKDSAAMGFDSVGYNTFVRNHLVDGSPAFSRVLLTSPRGHVFTLKPVNASVNRLGLVKGSTLTNTPILRLQWAFVDQTSRTGVTTGKDIANLETGLFFARDDALAPAPWSNADIQGIPAQGKWKFEFFNAGNTGNTPDATQWSTTLARPLTLSEMRAQPLASLMSTTDTAAAIDSANGGLPLVGTKVEVGDYDSATGWRNGWTVPAGAWAAPTSITLNGKYPVDGSPTAFTNSVSVKSSARGATMSCGAGTATGVTSGYCATDILGNYGVGTYAQGLELWGRNARAQEFSTFYALYKRVP